MDSESFHWSEPQPAIEKPDAFAVAPTSKWKPYLPYAFVIAIVGVLYLTKGASGSPAAPKADDSTVVEAVMPLLPVRKGQIIDFGTFEKVALREKSLTSSQRMRVVRNEHITALKVPLRAKKMLAPHQIVLWSDLETAPGNTGVTRTQIYFGN